MSLKTVAQFTSSGNGSGTVTSVNVSGGTTGLTTSGGPVTTSGTITLAGTLAVANGGTGITTSTGANSVVLRDANSNITANSLFEGFTSVAAAGTTTTLTVASTPTYVVTGSGGQTYKLPDATTLPAGAIFSFNNNQTSGTVVVQNSTGTTLATLQSGAFIDFTLLVNSTAAGTWDTHAQTPSNVSWSTNTLDWTGSITSATWNGAVVAPNRGGTGIANNTASTLAISGAFGTTLTVTGTTAITLPTSGTLSIVGPTFSAYVSSGQSITGGVATKIQYQTKEWDTASCYDNATNYRFTPTVAGYYQINASFNTNAAASTAYAMIYKNGSIYRFGTYIPSPQNGPIVTVSSIVYCNGSTDYIEIYGNTSVTGTTNTGTSNNYFTAAMIRGA